MNRYLKTALLGLASLSTTSAFAIPVTWTLQGMTFSNGSIATGAFDYDRDTNVFSNIAISVTTATDNSGFGFQAQTFDAIAPASSNWYGAIFTTLPISFNEFSGCGLTASCGTNGMLFSVQPSEMTNAGGTLSVTGGLLMCSDILCNTGGWSFSYLTSFGPIGSITAVPEAETYAMMLAGLGLVGWIARRRKQFC